VNLGYALPVGLQGLIVSRAVDIHLEVDPVVAVVGRAKAGGLDSPIGVGDDCRQDTDLVGDTLVDGYPGDLIGQVCGYPVLHDGTD
jgi:hypothetical protein